MQRYPTTPFPADNLRRRIPGNRLFGAFIACALLVLFFAPRAVASSGTAYLGQSVTFSVSVNGTAPFTYQWFKGGSPIPGATEATYTKQILSADDAGTYHVIVSNSAGTTKSDNAHLSVGTTGLAVITRQPTSLTVESGKPASLAVGCTSNGITAYQWYRGSKGDTSNPIATAYGPTFLTPGLTAWTRYWVRITNAAGSVDSEVALVKVTGGDVAFGEWMAQTTAPSTGPLESVAGDNVCNLVKFALGVSPGACAGDRLPRPIVVEGSNGRYFGLELTLMPAAQGISVGMEVSPDLSTWSDGDPAITVMRTNPDGTELVQLLEKVSFENQDRRFARLKVAAQP